MKKRLAGVLLGIFLILRLFPTAAIFWAQRISLPLLGILSGIGSSFTFALLEWLGCVLAGILGFTLLRRRFMRCITSVMLAAFALSVLAWYPLYFQPQEAYFADADDIYACARTLIDEINASPADIGLPDDLPAKLARFPGWMDALDISGVCSFLTGEALVSPELPASALPFVAVHESMHLRGHAGEGAANIAAWHECMARGGAYAASANLWALRYAMGILQREAMPLHDAALSAMDADTLHLYRECGGAYPDVSPHPLLRRIHIFLGIESRTQDYEILAPYLAAQCP